MSNNIVAPMMGPVVPLMLYSTVSYLEPQASSLFSSPMMVVACVVQSASSLLPSSSSRLCLLTFTGNGVAQSEVQNRHHYFILRPASLLSHSRHRWPSSPVWRVLRRRQHHCRLLANCCLQRSMARSSAHLYSCTSVKIPTLEICLTRLDRALP